MNKKEKIRKRNYNERYKYIKTEIPIEYLEKWRRGESLRLIARTRCGGKQILAGDGEKKMCTMSGRGRNIKSPDRKTCSDTQGIHPSRRCCARKNKREGRGMVKRLTKEEEKENIESVEQRNINKPPIHKGYITRYM